MLFINIFLKLYIVAVRLVMQFTIQKTKDALVFPPLTERKIDSPRMQFN